MLQSGRQLRDLLVGRDNVLLFAVKDREYSLEEDVPLVAGRGTYNPTQMHCDQCGDRSGQGVMPTLKESTYSQEMVGKVASKRRFFSLFSFFLVRTVAIFKVLHARLKTIRAPIAFT